VSKLLPLSPFEMRKQDLFSVFISDCCDAGLDPEQIKRWAQESERYYREPAKYADEQTARRSMEEYWYASLDEGEPAWEVYATTAMVADLWACWSVYSRGYLRALHSERALPTGSIIADIGYPVKCVVDLGCGIAYTTAALKRIWPHADVIGTNLLCTPQADVALLVAERYDFEISESIADVDHADVVFASEYFEHFQQPVAHLEEVLALEPRALITANCFSGRSIGHFDSYIVNGRDVSGRATSRAFGLLLRSSGYDLVETRLWNNRPTYWRRRS